MSSVGQREPPPYPGQGQSWPSLQGAHQSYSGSEPSTDISLSSTESLSTGARQEPQGQENSLVSTPRDSQSSSPFLFSNLENPDFKTSESAAYYMTSPLAMPALAGTEHLIGGGRSSRPGSQPGSRPSSRAGSRASSHVGSRGASPMKDEQRQAMVTTCRAVLPYTNPGPNGEIQNQPLQPIMKPVPSSPPVSGNNAKLTVPGVSPSSSQASPQASFRIKANSPNSDMVNQLQMLILQSQLQHQQGNQQAQKVVHQQQGDGQKTQQMQHQPQSQTQHSQRGDVQQMQQQAQIQQQRGEPHQIQQLLQQQIAERQQLQQLAEQQLHQQRVDPQQVQQPQRIPQQQRLQQQQQQSQPATRQRPSSAGSTPIHYHQGQGYIHTQGQGQGQITVGMSGNGAVENIHYSHSLRSCKSMSPTPVHMLRQEAVPRPATAPAAQSFPQLSTRSLRRSYEMLDRLAQDHPDLSRLAGDLHTSQVLMHAQQPTVVHVNNTPVPSKKKLPDLDHAAIATRATQMVERLSQENLSLRKELETYYNKVCKLQKFEGEIKKIHEAYESLVKHSQKRESLEKAMRNKLEAHVNTLNLNTHQLKEQLDKAMRRLATQQLCEGGETAGSDLIEQLHKKDAEMNKLIVRNRDLVVTNDRLKAEVETQRKTLQEQQAQISILDTALSHTQTHSLKYEEELSRRRVEEDRVSSLKQVLAQMQTVSEKRQSVDTQMIGNLRQEVTRLRQQIEGLGSVEREESEEGLTDLLQQLRQKDEHILQLQAQVLAWKQKFIEETSLRQIKSETESPIKDSRLDLPGSRGEVMAEGHSEKVTHREEVYLANKRAAEAESRLNALNAQLAEKEAMLRVLQRHPMLGRTANISTLLSSVHHSSLQSIVPHVSPISTSPLPSTPQSNYSNPPSTASSRQNSQLDSCTLLAMNSRGSPTTGNSHMETTMAIHNKSSSIGSTTTAASSTSSTNSINGESQLRDLHIQMTARAAMLSNLDPGQEQVKKCFWQV